MGFKNRSEVQKYPIILRSQLTSASYSLLPLVSRQIACVWRSSSLCNRRTKTDDRLRALFRFIIVFDNFIARHTLVKVVVVKVYKFSQLSKTKLQLESAFPPSSARISGQRYLHHPLARHVPEGVQCGLGRLCRARPQSRHW